MIAIQKKDETSFEKHEIVEEFNEIDNQYLTTVNVTHFSIFALVKKFKNYCEGLLWGNTSTKHFQPIQYKEYCRAKEEDNAIELFCYNETSENIF